MADIINQMGATRRNLIHRSYEVAFSSKGSISYMEAFHLSSLEIREIGEVMKELTSSGDMLLS